MSVNSTDIFCLIPTVAYLMVFPIIGIMLNRFFAKIVPTKEELHSKKMLSCFGTLLHRPGIWRKNRHAISRATAVGLFFSFIPVPFQMFLAVAGAVYFHANLPLSVALVWISNPITMPPLFYGAYLVGLMITGETENASLATDFTLSMAWVSAHGADVMGTFLFGCLVCAVVSALAGFIITYWIYRVNVMRKWHKRRMVRLGVL